MKDTFKSILGGIIIALFSASVGFGISQTTVASEVKRMSERIEQLRRDDDLIVKSTDSRITDLREITKEILKQNQEFIQLLKIQNELLMQIKK